MILALSSTGDITTDYVVRALQSSSQDVVRVNTDALLRDWRVTARQDGIEVRSDERSFRDDEVTAVYYRRAKRPLPHSDTHPDAQLFAYREATVTLRALYAQLRCPWISHHLAISAAENRLAQMYLAEMIGFRVPPWVSTNSCTDARAFYQSHDAIVAKALSYGSLGGGDVVHTTLLKAWEKGFDEVISVCPVLLQAFIDKTCDYRVTVVDDAVFACRIDSQSKSEYAVDMRRGLMDMDMAHEFTSCLNM